LTKKTTPITSKAEGQSPLDEGYFGRKRLNPLPYITDPNIKREDKVEFLSAKSTLPVPGMDEREAPSVSKEQETKDKINQYYVDKANMGIEEFKLKYPYGGQMMKMWKDELAEIVGEEESNTYMSSAFEAGNEKEEGYGENGIEKSFWGVDFKFSSNNVGNVVNRIDEMVKMLTEGSLKTASIGFVFGFMPEPFFSKAIALSLGAASIIGGYEAYIWTEAAKKLHKLAEENKAAKVSFNTFSIEVTEQ